MMTAIAFEYFAREKVELAVLEVGMGGRLDATNVVEPRVSVITDISLDHQKFLGNTVGEIAREKVGIIRPGGVVVTLPQQPEANDVIGNTILELGARAVNAVPYVPPVSPGSAEYLVPSTEKALTAEARMSASSLSIVIRLQVMGEQILVETPLVGRHQLRNVALAIAAAVELRQQGFSGITAKSIERGIRETRWPGRFQVIAGAAGVAGDRDRCGAQSRGRVGTAFGPFGALRRPSADFCFRRDAGQGNLRDDGDSVSTGRSSDRDQAGESAGGIAGGNSAGGGANRG